MRFGLGDDSDKSDVSSIYSYTSDESDLEVIPKRYVSMHRLSGLSLVITDVSCRYSEPISHLGRKIRGFVDSSDSEPESDDDWSLLPRVQGIG